MITAGIDMGSKTIKILFLEDNKILAQQLVLGGFDQRSVVEEAFLQNLKKANISRETIKHITVTGAGKRDVPFANSDVTEVIAAAKGAVFLSPSVRTVIDVGAEEGRGIRCDAEGKVIDFAINEKCAAGAGAFIEAMARALEVDIERMGKLALESQRAVPMNAQCAVFAESEVVTLIHAKTPKQDIAKAIHDAIASRIASTVRKIGFEREIMLIGGVAKNIGFQEALRKELDVEKLLIPQEPEFVAALGAATVAKIRASTSSGG
jgi:benzoyl-CoA reductase subunit D